MSTNATLVACDRDTLFADLARRGLQAPTPEAIAAGTARAIQTAAQLQTPSKWTPDYMIEPLVLVLTGQRSGRVALYPFRAYDEPAEAPILPWSAPEGEIIGWAHRDGSVQLRRSEG